MPHLKLCKCFIALGMSLGLTLGCQTETPPPAKEPPKVTVAHPIKNAVPDYHYYNGWLQSMQTVEIRSRVRGHIDDIHFEEGVMVEADKTVLFTIDKRPFQAVLDEAEANLQAAQARLTLAKAQFDRIDTLVRKGASSREELDIVTGQKDVAAADVVKATAAVEKAKLDVNFCTIKAPITGRVSRALITKGNLVNAGAGEDILTTIVSMDPIYAFFNIEERYWQEYVAKRIKTSASGKLEIAKDKSKGVAFEFGLEVDKDYPHNGMINFVENKIESSTGTLQIRGEVKHPQFLFMPGSRIKIRLSEGEAQTRWIVPDEAILADQGNRYLLLVNEKKVVFRRDVQLGQLLENGQRVLLPAANPELDLKDTDWIIIRGMQRARLDYPVEPLEWKPPEAPRKPAA